MKSHAKPITTLDLRAHAVRVLIQDIKTLSQGHPNHKDICDLADDAIQSIDLIAKPMVRGDD